MSPLSLSGIWRILRRLSIGLKRGRDYIHSPDPQYLEKLEAVELCRRKAEESGGAEVVALYTDEVGCYRQPQASRDYEERGSSVQPLARRSLREDIIYREVAALIQRGGCSEPIDRRTSPSRSITHEGAGVAPLLPSDSQSLSGCKAHLSDRG
jgi:hypothetical protein